MKKIISILILIGMICTLHIPSVIADTTECADLVDFLVDVEDGVAPRILQITDTQIIDSTQCRTDNRLGASQKELWMPEKMDENCYSIVRQTVEEFKPHLIILTGDFVYGEFDDNGTSFLKLVDFFDSLKTPWAPIYGNHEPETKMGVDWQCQQFEKSPYCLFEQRTLTGNGNYSVGISQNGKLKRVFYMLDSNGAAAMSAESKANGHGRTSQGFGNDQIEWYTASMQSISEISPDTKFSVAFHIQFNAFKEAIDSYQSSFEMPDSTNNQIKLNLDKDGKEGDFGYMGSYVKNAWDSDNKVFEGLKNLGVDSIFCGHVHVNNGSIVYDGVRLVFGLKSSVYDTHNRITEDGEITNSASTGVVPYVGGTAIILDEKDGTIDNIYNLVSEGMYVDVTSMGSYNVDTEIFTFDNVDVYVENKASVAYVNGGMVALSNKAVYVGNEKFYVPVELAETAKEITTIKNEKIKINVDYNTGKVSVDGYTSKGHKPVAVVVTKPEKTLSSNSTVADIAYLNHIYTNKDGLYHFEFYSDILQGEYVFSANYPDETLREALSKGFDFKNTIPELIVSTSGKELLKMAQVQEGDAIDVTLKGFDMDEDFQGVILIAQYGNNVLKKVDYLNAMGGSALATTAISKQAILQEDVDKIKIMYWNESNYSPITGVYAIQ